MPDRDAAIDLAAKEEPDRKIAAQGDVQIAKASVERQRIGPILGRLLASLAGLLGCG